MSQARQTAMGRYYPHTTPKVDDSSANVPLAGIPDASSYSVEPPKEEERLALEHANSSERDARITFEPEAHVYTIDGETDGYVSVTSVVGAYFSKFDGQAIAKRMVSKDTFYTRNGMKHDYERAAVKEAVSQGLLPEEGLLKMWNDSGIIARDLGTDLHYAIELYFNGRNPRHAWGLDAPMDPMYMQQVVPYLAQFHQDLEPYRTEMRIFDTDMRVAGTIDLLARRKSDGQFIIVDWKRSKNLTSYSYANAKCAAPLGALGDNSLNKYKLQLNLYRHILETKYNIPVAGMVLVAFHPSFREKKCREFEVPRMEYYTRLIVQEWEMRCEKKLWLLGKEGDVVAHRRPGVDMNAYLSGESNVNETCGGSAFDRTSGSNMNKCSRKKISLTINELQNQYKGC